MSQQIAAQNTAAAGGTWKKLAVLGLVTGAIAIAYSQFGDTSDCLPGCGR